MTVLIWNIINLLKIPKISLKTVRSVQTTYFARKILGCTSLGMAIAKCEKVVNIQHLKAENLTPEQCIKQACLLSVNSATTLLTTTSSVLLDVCRDYKDSLNRILTLLETAHATEGENPELWDEIVEARANVNKAKASFNELSSYMESVEKVVTSTTEAAFLAGAEYMCSALCERLYSAQKEISNQISDLEKLEKDYMTLQKEIVSAKEKDSKTKVKNTEISKVKTDEHKHFLQQ